MKYFFENKLPRGVFLPDKSNLGLFPMGFHSRSKLRGILYLKAAIGNKWLILAYSLFLFLGLLVGLSHFFSFSPFWAVIVLFGLIFIPGFSLARILKIEFSGFMEQIVTWMALGWLLILGTSFLAMIIKIDIGLLTTVYAIIMGLLFALALILDLFKKDRSQILYLGKIFRLSNLPLLIVLIVLAIILWLISIKGALFKGGDTLYHLSLLRKVIDGAPLTIQNLAYVKDSPDVAYIFPLWHIVMGIVTKIAHTNMFMVYREMPFALSALVFIVWYWLFKLILPNKSSVLIVFIFFILFNFNWNFGYIFSTLSISHTLTQLLFLPLLVGLSINYFFNDKAGKFNLFFISLLAILAGCVHLTVFFYFLFILVGIIIIFGLLHFKDPDFKPVFAKMIKLLLVNLGLILILGLIIQIKTRELTTMWSSFKLEDYPDKLRYNSFSAMSIFVKYAFLSLPLIVVLSQKYRKLSTILAGYLVFLVAYISPLHLYLNQILGYIFMKRLYDNLIWYWLPIGITFYFFSLFFDRLISRFSLVWLRIAEVLAVLLTILLIWAQTKFKFALQIYEKLTSESINSWLNQNISYLLIILFILVVITYLIQFRRPKFSQILVLNNFKSQILLSFTLFICIFFLAAINFEPTAKILKSKHASILFSPTIVTAEQYSLNYIGGQETLNFIKANIPPKSIFSTYGGFFYLPTVADVQMTSYSSGADQQFSSIYKNDSEIAIKDKIKLISDIKVQYLMVNASPAKSKTIQKNLDAYPQYFEKIYNKKVVIYKINQENIQKDLR